MLAVAVGLAFFGATATAEDFVGDQELDAVSDPTTTPLSFSAGRIRSAPIPFRSPTVGYGLSLIAGYLFKADEGSDTSHIGFGGFRCGNSSVAFGLADNS